MRTEKTGQNGFVMILVIVIIALVGTYMIILAADANTFAFEADRAYLEAGDYNLCASALAWAKQNVNSNAGIASLDTAGMNMREASLSVTISVATKGKAQIEINSSCSRAGHRLASSKKATVGIKP